LKNKFLKLVPIIFVLSAISMTILGCQGQTTNLSPMTSSSVSSELSVFAGSASKPPLDEIGQAFTRQTGTKVYLTYGGSGAVLSQMELAKAGDVYIPGSPDFMAKADRDKVTDPATAQIAAYLIPTIGVQHGNPQYIRSLADLTKAGLRIGIGNPQTVCVGLYAIEILDYNSLLTKVYPNIVTQADSCDKTAALISLKAVDVVFGWDVFHSWNPDLIDTICLLPDQLPRIAYIPAAVATYTKDRPDAQKFIDFLVSPDGQAIFQKWGYIVNEDAAHKYAPKAKIGGEYQLPEEYKTLSR
jgi:molybdate transport system substrate-binding protein